jgi:hypothetical protein
VPRQQLSSRPGNALGLQPVRLPSSRDQDSQIERERALKFLRFLGKLLVQFIVINESLSGNFPKHGRFKSIILLQLREFGWRV